MLILLRHGRTAANAAGQLQGRLDLPLDELGRVQAEAAARHLGVVDRVISSPLRRARETAEALGSDVTVDDRWIELDYGVLDGVAVRDVPPETWAEWRRGNAFAPEGGEPITALADRVTAATQELRAEAADADVVVVSHMSPIKVTVAWALGVGLGVQWRLHLGQASICRIDTRRDEPLLVTFNEQSHLAGLGR